MSSPASKDKTPKSPLSPRLFVGREHGIQRHNIDEEAIKILLRLTRQGHSAYIVGGGVRDLLLGKKPKDFDISTDATPKQIKSLFRNSRVIGRRFKLVHIFFGRDKIIEVSTFRDLSPIEEPSEDGEPPNGAAQGDNVFGTEETDALRRDITINGLYYDINDDQIIDYVEGMEDLQRGIIRVIGEPCARFREDAVRMLRVVRHAARNGFSIDPPTWDAIISERQLLGECSAVRVFDELKKDLSSGHFLTFLSLLGETHLLEMVLPELLENNGRLLSATSDLSRCLEQIDELIQEGYDISPTVSLAVLGLFLSADSISLADMTTSFEDGREFKRLFADAFTLLAVPRRERERIEALVGRWIKLSRTDPRTMKPGQLKRVPDLRDLYYFSRITTVTREDEARLRIIAGALEA